MENASSKEVLTAITIVQQDIKYMSKQLEGVTQMSDKVIRLEESNKVAHKRIDATDEEIEKMKSMQRQTWFTLLGSFLSIAAGLILFAITN